MSDQQPGQIADTAAVAGADTCGRLVAPEGYDLSHWDGHQPWHMLVPRSVGGGFGWCLDCLRIVPVVGSDDA